MHKFTLAAVAALALSVTSAGAADMAVKARPMAAPPPPPVWDIAFGAAVASDYVWRGISQSAQKPSVAAYFEPRYSILPNLYVYGGFGGASIKFPNGASAEMDIYGGIRPTIGKLALDFGAWYYWYPGGETTYTTVNFGVFNALPNASFYELYARGNYTVTDWFAVGFNVYWTPDYLNTGADGVYYSGVAKVTVPGPWMPAGIGAYASAEIGRQDLGTSKVDGLVFLTPTDIPSYTTWNVGLGFTWKVFTLDLRYIDTDLSKENCFIITGDPRATPNAAGFGRSKWCDATFVARLSADLTVNDNLK